MPGRKAHTVRLWRQSRRAKAMLFFAVLNGVPIVVLILAVRAWKRREVRAFGGVLSLTRSGQPAAYWSYVAGMAFVVAVMLALAATFDAVAINARFGR
jgi:hypothetical protein